MWPILAFRKDSRIDLASSGPANLGVENMTHYKKTTLEIHNTEVNFIFSLS